MATITVRNLPDDVQRALRQRAAAHDRSMEAEVRAILEEAVSDRGPIDRWLRSAAEFRDEFGGVELDLPERAAGRAVEFP